jgi:hypothetical protein
MSGLKGVGIKGVCHRCGEEVELILTKKQLKAILKGMKQSTPSNAEMVVESALGRDKTGALLG